MIHTILFIINVLIVTSVSANEIDSPTTHNIKNNIHKCCPLGTYVGIKKSCVDYNIVLNFSSTKIYDEDIYLTGKLFEDVFTLIPNKFSNATFRKNALDVSMLEYNVYLIESGVIQVEEPNAYQRWREVTQDSYCIDIDYRYDREPRFWVTLPPSEEPFITSNPYLTTATLISCFFLLLVLIVYFLLPELQNLCGMILMAYVFSLLMAFLLLIILQMDNTTSDVCMTVAVGIYFFFLAAFSWMSVMSYDMWWTFRRILESRQPRRGKGFKFLMYCLCAWGVPLLMTFGLVMINSHKAYMRRLPWFITPGIPEKGCFLRGGVKLLYFYIPMLILIICNWIFFLMTAFNIWNEGRGSAVLHSSAAGNSQTHGAQKQRLMVFLKLSVVMGLSWLLEVISFMWPGYNMWFISDAYNSLIGLMMFLIFVFKKNIYKKLRKRLLGKKTCRVSSKSTGCSNLDSRKENIPLQSKVHPLYHVDRTDDDLVETCQKR